MPEPGEWDARYSEVMQLHKRRREALDNARAEASDLRELLARREEQVSALSALATFVRGFGPGGPDEMEWLRILERAEGAEVERLREDAESDLQVIRAVTAERDTAKAEVAKLRGFAAWARGRFARLGDQQGCNRAEEVLDV